MRVDHLSTLVAERVHGAPMTAFFGFDWERAALVCAAPDGKGLVGYTVEQLRAAGWNCNFHGFANSLPRVDKPRVVAPR
jgi:hypothetical protein